MMNKKTVLKRVGIAAGIIAAIIGLYIFAVYQFVFVPSFKRLPLPTEERNRKHFITEEYFQMYQTEKAWFETQDVEKIEVTSFDGLKLVARVVNHENAKGTFILMHGYHSEPVREFARLIHLFHDNGYNVVLPYQRTHGESEGKYITFGVKERYDLRDWIGKINEIYGDDSPVYLGGISMGCATTVMTLGFELPENVKGVFADCGFTTPYEIVWKVLTKDMKLPTASLIMKLGNFFTRKLAGFDMNEYSTLTALKKNKIPVLFIHGAADDFVPVEMGIANFQYCTSEKYLYLVEGCPHALANYVQPEKYDQKVLKLLEK